MQNHDMIPFFFVAGVAIILLVIPAISFEQPSAERVGQAVRVPVSEEFDDLIYTNVMRARVTRQAQETQYDTPSELQDSIAPAPTRTEFRYDDPAQRKQKKQTRGIHVPLGSSADEFASYFGAYYAAHVKQDKEFSLSDAENKYPLACAAVVKFINNDPEAWGRVDPNQIPSHSELPVTVLCAVQVDKNTYKPTMAFTVEPTA